jgi:hypothetical protein
MLNPESKGNLLRLTVKFDEHQMVQSPGTPGWIEFQIESAAFLMSTFIFQSSSEIYGRMSGTVDSFPRASADGDSRTRELVLHFPEAIAWGEIEEPVYAAVRRSHCLVAKIELTDRAWSDRFEGAERQ